MQQNLLVERVHLAVHMETKVIRGYELSIDRGGLKLEIAKRVDPEQSAVRPVRPNPRAIDQNGFPLPDTPGYVNIAGHAKYFSPSMTMKQFALMLHNHLGAPVSDATGLSGEYEIRLLWIMQATRQPDSAWSDSVPELQQALQRQLGLRLDEVKVKADVLVIDQVDRTPVAN
jgi:uncharacterized protein (TIGR03435 family)